MIVAALATKGNRNSDTGEMADKNNQEQTGSINNSNNISASVLEGILRYSDDPFRGNLKLVSQYSDIYVRTARDFSSLIGLEVLVRINGTLDKFELLDVELKVTRDGYILQQ